MRRRTKPEVWHVATSVARRVALGMVCAGMFPPIGAIAGIFASSSAIPQKPGFYRPFPTSFINYFDQSFPGYRRWVIPALSTVLIVQSILIFVLLRHRREAKSQKQVLLRKEAELAETQYLAELGNWTWNPKTDAISCSHELSNLLGIDTQLQILTFHEFSRFFTPESWKRLSQSMKTGLQTGASFELEVAGLRWDGMQIWVTVRGQAVHDVPDHVLQLRGTMQNVSQRKQAEQTLLESEERSRLVAELIPALMWWCGPDKQCTNVNKEWLSFTGRAMREELGDGWLDNVHPDDLHTFLLMFSSPFDKGQNAAVEYRMRRNDGQYRWMRCTSSPRFLVNENFAGYIGCCTDVTDEKKAKTASAEFGSKLIRAQEEERARIARELHDDINQRLALLANGLENLGQDHGDRDDLRRVRRKVKARELWQLANDIAVDIQHLSHQLHPSKVHYLGLTAAVRDLCQEFSRQHEIGVECIVQDLPKNLENGVSLNLYRVIQECLHNVAKHSQARHVKVELTRKSTLLHLCVSDDGIGFNPADVASKGLGLISMRERLRSVSGEFFVWSKPSHGTQLGGIVPATVKHARSEEAAVADQYNLSNASPPSLLTVAERPRGI